MTSTWLLTGAAIGFTIAIGIGLWRTPHIYARQLEQFEPQIPTWVNQGNRAIRDDFYEDFKAAVHFLLWEDELEEQS